MSIFTQRTLTFSDYTICRRMLLEVFGDAELRQFEAAWGARSETASFATIVDDRVIGYILVDIHNKIEYLCVDPVFRNARLGSTLLMAALGRLQEEGAREITLTTAKDSRLTGWYAKFGFKVVRNLYDATGEFAGADMRLLHT